ncbi:MAG: RNA 2',3'-cyclic phosphodiesterase, partial [Myxococcaceae bacterium]
MPEAPSPRRRLFVAVEIEDDQKRRIGEQIESLEALAPKAKFVRAEKLHLTLQFLGHVDAEKVPEIEAAIDRGTSGHAAHTLALKGGGAFGSKKAPRVLWIGVEGELEPLGALQSSISKELEKLGFEP